MKSFKPLSFTLGMTGMFSMAFAGPLDWLTGMPATQASLLAVALALACAAALAWLTQFRRRHAGSPAWLHTFAGCGLLVSLLPLTQTLTPLPLEAGDTLAAVLRLALFALFCLVAVQTQPASEHAEGAL
ncbi:hypothetical protein VVD49_02205 [Uliginosibacterium sp. H3]|uniref:Uncharacterized protein n=1 Tax=Uliginosibacterium silvisoli TaxID=3114758 RepID=A0ABU6JYM4_9RHOO|nr:hypothetical protein [Uliginosibacterium sp. H3]